MPSKACTIVVLTLTAVAASSCASPGPIEAPLPVCAAIGGVIGGSTAGVVADNASDQGSNVVLAVLGGLVLGELIGGALCGEEPEPPSDAVSGTPTSSAEHQ